MSAAFPEDSADQAAEQKINSLSRGSLLLATEELEDPNFRGAVLLVCMYTNETTMGLVCNRPAHMPLCEIFSIDTPQKLERRKVYIGGPVQQDSLQILQITDAPVRQAYAVAPGVYLGGEWNSLEAILGADLQTTRLFLGYAGWAPEQLENEIRMGIWDVYNVNLNSFFAGGDAPLLHADVRQIGTYLESLA
jgi:putative transcriptional regulator